jgi:glycosyltransferase involved in cell wall biosynthesis
VLHLVDGDFDTWVYSCRARWLHTKISATFHQPVDKLGSIVSQLRPGMLDGIVCVSRNQMPYLSPLVPYGRCVFIPHGVDTDFFYPEEARSSHAAPLLLAVGTHRRDFNTLFRAVKIIKARRPHVRFRIIGNVQSVASIPRDDAIETVSNVSDEVLRASYREASLLFLPLEQASANNALLESMACGLPAVITDLPAVRDYTSEDAAILCPFGDASAHAEAALALLDDSSRRIEMGRAAYALAGAYAWPKVRQEVGSFLASICSA